jgi:hypothetical protein
MAETIHIAQRNLHRHTGVVQSLTVTVRYGEGLQNEATILVRPGESLPNDDKSIRDELERLGHALIAAAQSRDGVTAS